MLRRLFVFAEDIIYRNWAVVAGGLLLISSVLVYWLYSFDVTTRHVVRIAASDRFDDSYQVAQVLAEHVNANSSSIFVEVLETQGSKANSKLLLNSQVDFAFVHYDPQLVGRAYSIAKMFPDVVQILARPGLHLKSISDLKGKRIALATNQGIEAEVFELIIQHYGLDKSSMQLLETSWRGTTWTLSHNLIDVVFRVKSAANPEVIKLINTSNAEFFGVDQANALIFKYPHFKLAEISVGTFRGSPAVPQQDILTVGIDRYLVASASADAAVVEEITRILFEEKPYLILRSPLFGFTSMPGTDTSIPLHDGAAAYFDREMPSFWQQNAELIALIITIIAISVSVFVNINNQSKRKRVNDYNRRLLALRLKIENARDQLQLTQLKEELNGFIGRVVEDAIHSRISTDGFEFFAFTWENVKSLMRDKDREFKTSAHA
jgi:TRAP transporter TAXI family solute receptor